MSAIFMRTVTTITTITVLAAVSCVKPVFLDKNSPGFETKVKLVLIPAACYGRFSSLEEKSENKEKNMYSIETKFRDWREFNSDIDKIVIDKFEELAADIFYINDEQVLKAFNALTAVDTTRNALKEFFSLQDILGSLIEIYLTNPPVLFVK